MYRGSKGIKKFEQLNNQVTPNLSNVEGDIDKTNVEGDIDEK